MVKRLTGSAAMVGFVGALEAAPYLLFSAPAGVLADRIDRKRIMLSSDLLSGLILGVFALSLLIWPHTPTWLLLTTPAVLSCVRVFFLPAKSAAIPALVPADMLQQANAFSMMTQSMMPLVGLGFAAAVLGVLAQLNAGWFFPLAIVINGLSFWGSALFIARLPKLEPMREDLAEKHPWHDFLDGWAFVARRKDLTVLMGTLSIFRLMVAPFWVCYVVANDRWFGGKPQTLAWFEFSFFAGMVVFSPIVGRWKIRRPMMLFMVSLGGLGVLVALMAYAPYFWPFLILNLLCGFCVPMADIPVGTYVQAAVPDGFRGRVNSVMSMILMGVNPIGMAMAGWLVAVCGLVNTFLIMGIGMLVGMALGSLSPEFRNAKMPESPARDALATAGS